MVISEKFIEIFNWYEGDLEDIQHLYEKFKVIKLYFLTAVSIIIAVVVVYITFFQTDIRSSSTRFWN